MILGCLTIDNEACWRILTTFSVLFNMVFIQACRKFLRDTPLVSTVNTGARSINASMTFSRLQLHWHGCCAGNHQRRRVLATHTVTSSISQPNRAGDIPHVIGNRGLSNVNISQLYHGHRDARMTAAKTVPRCSRNNDIRLGLFNARSVSD